VLFDVVDQIHTKVVKAKIGDGNTCFQVFQLDHFFLQAAELFFAVGDLAALGGQDVIVARGRHVGDDHAVFDALFQVDIFVERNIGPVIDQLDAGVGGTDAVNAPETLNDANGVPVNVVVDQIIAVLKVLAFGDAIRADQNVQFALYFGHDQRLFLRARRKERQDSLEVISRTQC